MRAKAQPHENLTIQSVREIFALWNRPGGSGEKLDLSRSKQGVGPFPQVCEQTGLGVFFVYHVPSLPCTVVKVAIFFQLRSLKIPVAGNARVPASGRIGFLCLKFLSDPSSYLPPALINCLAIRHLLRPGNPIRFVGCLSPE
jgi:hypothetical protein